MLSKTLLFASIACLAFSMASAAPKDCRMDGDKCFGPCCHVLTEEDKATGVKWKGCEDNCSYGESHGHSEGHSHSHSSGTSYSHGNHGHSHGTNSGISYSGKTRTSGESHSYSDGCSCGENEASGEGEN